MLGGYLAKLESLFQSFPKIINYGGWIGTVIGGSASYLKVQDVCAAGATEACERVKLTETGSFVGTVAGGVAAGAALTVPVVGAICVGLGVPTGGIGTLVCGVMVVGVGSLGASLVGGEIGESIGEKIYEASQ